MTYPFNTFCLIWEMWVEEANPNTPNTPPSHSWGRFSAHISQIKQKVLKGYMAHIIWGFSFFAEFLEKPKLPEKLVIESWKIQKPVKLSKHFLKIRKYSEES